MQDVPAFQQPEELEPWQEHSQRINIQLEELPAPISFRCANSNLLYPTHPLQQGKEYHQRQQSRYAPENLDGRDIACGQSRVRQSQMPLRAIANNIERHNARYGADTPLVCNAGARVQRAVLSYTYIDECGNYYRGVWTARFVGPEPDSALWARGIEMPGGRLRPTIALPYTDFDLLMPLFPGDLDAIGGYRTAALRRDFTLAADQLIFIPT